MTDNWTPPKAANRLSHIANQFTQIHGTDRFPVDVPLLARETAQIFGWNDPISTIEAVDLPGFEGALFPNDDRSAWMLLYNNTVRSKGRIRFTQAHELGHYILHRQQKESFQCSEQDMLDWSEEERSIEAQADQFASNLLMPLDDFRQQAGNSSDVNLDILSDCADRYGVSLTAAILKWLQVTDQTAILVLSRDGYMLWASSSKSAMKAGAFFKTRHQTIAIPAASLAANHGIASNMQGQELPARIWFPHSEAVCPVTEMKLYASQYDWTVTLLILPRVASVWEPCRGE
jgi:Zn-dependent peptidase ImmA (M78 family)|tara:strand:- start:1890 stop:2756 length:867 start_codon:yes stop_codon:yes gene_type:complete